LKRKTIFVRKCFCIVSQISYCNQLSSILKEIWNCFVSNNHLAVHQILHSLFLIPVLPVIRKTKQNKTKQNKTKSILKNETSFSLFLLFFLSFVFIKPVVQIEFHIPTPTKTFCLKSRPESSKLPLLDVPVSVLFSLLSFDNVIAFISAILCERKVKNQHGTQNTKYNKIK